VYCSPAIQQGPIADLLLCSLHEPARCGDYNIVRGAPNFADIDSLDTRFMAGSGEGDYDLAALAVDRNRVTLRELAPHDHLYTQRSSRLARVAAV
jgi:hypothetical protein